VGVNRRLSAVGIVGIVLIIIGWMIFFYGARTFQKPEDMPNWLPWAQWASWIGGILLWGAVVFVQFMRLWGKK
jgi:uncharacterized membrane protein